MKKFVFLSGICVLLAGCDSDEKICDFSEAVQLQVYDRTFRNSLAEDVDHICGNDEKGIPAEYQHACKFIQDSLELRAKISAIQDN